MFSGGPTGEGLRASFERVLAEGQVNVLALLRYDVQVPGSPGVLEERYWNAVNSPLLGPGGRVVLIVQTGAGGTVGSPRRSHHVRSLVADGRADRLVEMLTTGRAG